MAIQTRNPAFGVIHHSRQCPVFACQDSLKVLSEHQFKISMSRTGNPCNSAFAASFMKILKEEEVRL